MEDKAPHRTPRQLAYERYQALVRTAEQEESEITRLSDKIARYEQQQQWATAKELREAARTLRSTYDRTLQLLSEARMKWITAETQQQEGGAK